MKISKLLPITLALSLCMSTATFAATEETKQLNQADYKLYLEEFLDIEVTAPDATGAMQNGCICQEDRTWLANYIKSDEYKEIYGKEQ